MRRNLFTLLLAALVWGGSPIALARAQAPPKDAAQIYADAVDAYEQQDYQRSLDLLELAIFKDPQPRYQFQRILVLEAMGRVDDALQMLEQRRKKLAGQPGVGDLTALEQRLREAGASTDANLTADTTEGRNDEPDYIGWTFVASGALAAGGGVAFLLVGESQLAEVRCSGIYPDSQRQDCAGVEAPAQLSRAEFDRRIERVDTYRILGGSLLAVGVLAAGYGSYRLLTTETAPTASTATGGTTTDTVVIDAAPRLEGGLEVHLRWRF